MFPNTDAPVLIIAISKINQSWVAPYYNRPTPIFYLGVNNDFSFQDISLQFVTQINNDANQQVK